MAFKFQAPIKMPRFTREEFIKRKEAYVAKHGYTINIPGFSDIFTYNVTPEPTKIELGLYRSKKVAELGEARYEAIKALMLKKKENYLRMLSSPTPQIIQNAASVMTTLDDINDVFGTVAVVIRIVARRLPAAAAKILLGPAGWALTVADIAGLAMQLYSLPFKARRIQHELNDAVKGNPLSKKAKLNRLNKLKRVRITKGELIEALQTTDNMFGVGLSLGPIMGLLIDIPAGLYHHVRGHKVEIMGLPAPLLWFDRQWSALLKGIVGMFYGPVDLPPEEMNKAIIATNLATQAAYSYLDGVSPLDAISEIPGTELRAPEPQHPSTIEVIEAETGEVQNTVGWIHNSKKWQDSSAIFDRCIEPVQETIKGWIDENKNSMEGQVAAQNMVEVGPNMLAMLEGDDQVEMSYDAVTESLLELMNVNLRFPLDLTDDQVSCWASGVSETHRLEGGITRSKAQDVAKDKCGFQFTTEVPEREGPTEEELAFQKLHNIDRLRNWHFGVVVQMWILWNKSVKNLTGVTFDMFLSRAEPHFAWLERYGYADGNPGVWIGRMNEAQLEFYKKLIGLFP